jgi:hypothetical protein
MDLWEYIKQGLANYQPGTATGLPVPTPDAARQMASGVAAYGQHLGAGILDTVNTPRDVMSGALDPTSPEGTDRIIGMAASMPALGMRFAEPGAVGIAGGKAVTPPPGGRVLVPEGTVNIKGKDYTHAELAGMDNAPTSYMDRHVSYDDAVQHAKDSGSYTPEQISDLEYRAKLYNQDPDAVAQHRAYQDARDYPGMTRGSSLMTEAQNNASNAALDPGGRAVKGDPAVDVASQTPEQFQALNYVPNVVTKTGEMPGSGLTGADFNDLKYNNGVAGWGQTANEAEYAAQAKARGEPAYSIDDRNIMKARVAAGKPEYPVSDPVAIADRIASLNPNGLSMAKKDVAARAKDLGFGTTTYYHGTPEAGFDSFKPSDGPDSGLYFTKSKQVADSYSSQTRPGANIADNGPGVYPTRLRMDNPQTIDFSTLDDPILAKYSKNPGDHPTYKGMGELIDRAKSLGHDSMILKGIKDVTGGDMYNGVQRRQDQYVVFDPSQVRSKFATFDPARKGDSDIMAAGGLGVPAVGNVYDDPKYSIPAQGSAKQESKNLYDTPEFSVPPPKTGAEQPEGALGYVNAAARAAANSATFGGADKLANLIHRIAGTPGDEEQNTATARKEYPYTSLGGEIAGAALPGAGISNIAGRAIPALGRATIASMAGNGAVTGATMAGATDAAKGETDPANYATDMAIQGVGGGLLGGVVGGVVGQTPMGKFRAAGAHLDPAARDAAAAMAERSGAAGVPLTATEAVRAVAPEQVGPLEAFHNSAVRSPAGSVNNAGFEAGRSPLIDIAARRAALAAGPEVAPITAQNAAVSAIDEARQTINRSADPYYRAAMRTPMEPHTTEIPEVGHVAARDLLGDPMRLGDLSRTLGKPVTGRGANAGSQDSVRRDISALLPPPEPPAPTPGGPVNDNLPQPPEQIPLAIHDKVKHVLGTLYTRAADEKPDVARTVAQERDRLNAAMGAASPQYAQATDIENMGRSMMLDHVQNGPLGTIAATGNPATQSRALFGASTPMEADDAIRAASRMSGIAERQGNPDPSLGLLSGHLQRAAAAGPRGFADALPNDASMRVAQAVGGNRLAPVADTVDALRALRPNTMPASSETHGYGVSGLLWRGARDLGKGRQVDILQDPSNIPLLGTRAGSTTNSLAALISMMNDAEQRRAAR